MNINDLKHELGSGASRAKYKVHIPIPLILRGMIFGNKLLSKIPLVGGILASGPKSTPDASTIATLAKATTIPGKTVGATEVYSRGVKYVIRGVAEFPNRWDVTFYNTSSMALRQFFEEWMHQIDSSYSGSGSATTFASNFFGTSDVNSGYMTDLEISQLCQNGKVTATWTIFKAFPVEISAVELDASNANEISDFVVTFAYSNWKASEPEQNFLQKTAKSLLNYF